MAKQQIVIELEEEVVQELITYGKDMGWTLEEATRNIIESFILSTTVPQSTFVEAEPSP